MIQIGQLKCPVGHEEGLPEKEALRHLRLNPGEVEEVKILKRSLDARKKPDLYFVYTLLVKTKLSAKKEMQLVKKLHRKDIVIAEDHTYHFPESGDEKLKYRPVIVGFGPAGMLCGLLLAKAGYEPLIIERGKTVEERTADVETFWRTGKLDPESNVQFGEGGAGTFSDGKLNTMVKDPEGRGRKVLEVFVEAGAPEDILYVNKPHVGTDILKNVVANIRDEILMEGGEIMFETRLTDLFSEDGVLTGIEVETNGGEGECFKRRNLMQGGGPCSGMHSVNQKTRVRMKIPCEVCVLAVGHSARDTFEMLHRHGIAMQAKSFAVGMRIEHPQRLINESQYGKAEVEGLGAADYKLTHRAENGRGVYSFCMCPGGVVVNSSSEEDRLTVNGMSYRARDGRNANSAMIVTVNPEDYPDNTPLGGMHFQRELEHKAFVRGNGKIPMQKFGDFCADQASEGPGEVIPDHKGESCWTNLRGLLPKACDEALIEGIGAFDRKIKGFAREDAVLSGVEARTSSPVRITRDENMMCSLKGLYPCGEGPGYAGGITSAAMDGCRVAEIIAGKYSSQ